MPLSDWRPGDEHADIGYGSIYNLDYLTGNVAGGEGYDWYYADNDARQAQRRTAIRDGLHGEDWIFRYKDIASWWSKPHYNRLAGVRSLAPTDWQAGSKPIWFTELGCPAVDHGTNQPNVFVDPKSSESFLPHFSEGIRDDFIQQRYLQATFRHWSDPANNPQSEIYAGPMVDLDHAHVWAWDARPWPDFPARLETWTDGENYSLGHWLNGRTSVVSVAEIVTEVIGNTVAVDQSRLHGAVTGYTVDGVESPRQTLQPLMLAYGFDGYADGDGLAFVSRDGQVAMSVDADRLACEPNLPLMSRTRGPVSEAVGRVTLGFVRADADYQLGAAEATADGPSNTSQSTTAIVLREAQAQRIADRWLSEGLIARETVEFALAPSMLAAQPGDVLNMVSEDGGSELYRVDRIEGGGSRHLVGVRVERGAYVRSLEPEVVSRHRTVDLPTPVYAEILDLPLISGEEIAHAPHVAAIGRSGGGIAVYSAVEDHGYSLNRTLHKLATMGETLTPLPRAEAGLWMPATLDVNLRRGALHSRSHSDVLNGANAAAIRSGNADWEIIQFQSAELIGNRRYRLAGLIRGQAGTDGIMPDEWPVGSDLVVLDAAVVQIDHPLNARGLRRNYRIGPAAKPHSHRTYFHISQTCDAVGLRPYAPAHLNATRRENGDILLTWVRRTRIDGDNWQGTDVPLGEASESYSVRVLVGGDLVRELHVGTPFVVYARTEQIIDRAQTRISFEVAQVSEQFGPGPYRRTFLDG